MSSVMVCCHSARRARVAQLHVTSSISTSASWACRISTNIGYLTHSMQPAASPLHGRAILRRLRPHAGRLAGAVAFRYTCYAIMIALCLYAERRPAPHLPDLIIDRLPYQALVDRW